MKNIKYFTLLTLTILWVSSCNVENIDTYNEDFIGDWRTNVSNSSLTNDSIRSYLRINGKNSAYGLACDKNDPFNDCVTLQEGRVKYNKVTHQIQVGSSMDEIHSINEEPFINDEGKWELVMDKVSFYKYE